MSLDTTGVDFKIYLEEFRKDLNEIKTGLKGVGDNADNEAKRMDSTFSKIGGALAGYFSVQAISNFIGSIISVRSEFEKFEAVLTNSLGSESAAADAMNELQQFAATTPFQLDQLTASYVKLVNQGFKPSMDEMRSLGDLAASTGKEFDQLTEAIIDAQVGEFERLKEFGVRAQKEGDKVKFTFKGVTTEVQNTSDAIKNYIVGLGNAEGVTGSMAAISETLGGKISNLKDSWDSYLNVLGSRSSGVFSWVIGQLNSLINMMSIAAKTQAEMRKQAQDEVTKKAIKQDIEDIAALAEKYKTLGFTDSQDRARKAILSQYETLLNGLNQKILNSTDEAQKEQLTKQRDLLQQQIAGISYYYEEQEMLRLKQEAALEAARLAKLEEQKKENEEALKAFKEYLNNQKQEYQEYEAWAKLTSQTEAEEKYSSLMKQGKNYLDFLKKLFDSMPDSDKKGIVALELVSNTKDTKTGKAKELGKDNADEYYNALLERTRSYEQQLGDIYLQYIKDRTILENNGQKERIAILDEETQQKIEALKKQEGQYDWLYKNIENYSRKELRNYIERIRQELALSKLSAEQRIEMEKALAAAQEKLDTKLADNLNDVASVLGEAANLAAVFDENLADAINTAAELASGVANIAAGMAEGGNPIDVISGVLQVFTSLNSLFDSSSNSAEKVLTASEKLAQVVEKLNVLFSNLDRSIDNAIGIEKIIKIQKALETASSEFNKLDSQTYNILGFTGKIADFYRYVLNSQSEMEKYSQEQIDNMQEWLDAYDELADKQAEYQDMLNEMLTGTTFESIRDEIKTMFDEGKTSVEDFTDYFETLMKQAILESLSVKYLDQAMADFYAGFAAAFADSNLTPEEKAKLQADFMASYQPYLEAVNAMQEMFPDLFATDTDTTDTSTTDTSTAGAIKNIQEETANILAGHIGNIRVNVAGLVAGAAKHLEVLNKMDNKLGKIEKYTKETRDALTNSNF